MRIALYLLRLLLVGGIVGGALLVGGFTKIGLDDYLHPPRTPAQRTPAELGLAHRDVWLTTDDGLRIAAWYVPGTRRETLILVHGLGGNRSSMLALASHMHTRGYTVFLPELRAHGESDGAVSTLGVKEVLDIRAAVRFLQQQPEVDPERIGIFGDSLGSSVALIAASALPELRAVAADSTFASVQWLVEHQLSALVNLPQWFSGLLLFAGGLEAGIDPSDLSPMHAAARLGNRPLLLIHGTEDTLFKLQNAQLVHDAAAGPRELWIVEGAGHSGAYTKDPARYVARLDAFFGDSLRAAPI